MEGRHAGQVDGLAGGGKRSCYGCGGGFGQDAELVIRCGEPRLNCTRKQEQEQEQKKDHPIFHSCDIVEKRHHVVLAPSRALFNVGAYISQRATSKYNFDHRI